MTPEEHNVSLLGPSRRGGTFFSFVQVLLFVLVLQHILTSYVADCVVAVWEGPQLLLAKVKDADGQDWYIYITFQSCPILDSGINFAQSLNPIQNQKNQIVLESESNI